MSTAMSFLEESFDSVYFFGRFIYGKKSQIDNNCVQLDL